MNERIYRPYHKRIDGEEARDAGGSHFQSSQGEHHQMTGPWGSLNHRYAHGEAQMFVVQVEGGRWLAGRDAYQDEPTFETREEAIAEAARHVIERVTWASVNWKQISVDHANHIAAWAASIAKLPAPDPIKPEPPPLKKGQIDLF